MTATVTPSSFVLPTDYPSTATAPEPSPSGSALQPQVTPTPLPWPATGPIPPPSSSNARWTRSVETHAGAADPKHPAGRDGTHGAPPPLSAQAQKLQQLPAEQQRHLLQQNDSINTRQAALHAGYPTMLAHVAPRMQEVVNQTYGPGHDAKNLYLVEYEPPKDAHGYPNPAAGRPISAKPLAEVLVDNMPTSQMFGNVYDSSHRIYNIVSGEDRSKSFDDAHAPLNPIKLYHALNNVDFQSEQVQAIDNYYDAHRNDLVQLARDKALTQLDVQHATEELDDNDYAAIKKLLQSGQGGKIHTLSTGSHNLAGGFRIELDSGQNFVYLSKENKPYQKYANADDALKAIRTRGKDPKTAESFVSKHQSLLGDDSFKHGNAEVTELRERYGKEDDGLATMAFNGRKVDPIRYTQLLHGAEYEITKDPFGEMVHLSKQNDVREAKAAIQSNEDITHDELNRGGKVAFAVVTTTLPAVPGLTAAEAAEGARVTEGVAEGVAEGAESTAAKGEQAAAQAEDTASASEVPGASGKAIADAKPPGTLPRSDGNLGAIDELGKAKQAHLLSLKTDVDPEQLELIEEPPVYRHKENHDDYVLHGGNRYRVKKDNDGWVIVNPRNPNTVTGGIPIKLNNKGGVAEFLDGTPGIKGGMDGVDLDEEGLPRMPSPNPPPVPEELQIGMPSPLTPSEREAMDEIAAAMDEEGSAPLPGTSSAATTRPGSLSQALESLPVKSNLKLGQRMNLLNITPENFYEIPLEDSQLSNVIGENRYLGNMSDNAVDQADAVVDNIMKKDGFSKIGRRDGYGFQAYEKGGNIFYFRAFPNSAGRFRLPDQLSANGGNNFVVVVRKGGSGKYHSALFLRLPNV